MTEFTVLQTTEVWTGATLSHSATITWTASVDTVQGYNIYRSTATNTEVGPALNTAPLTSTSFVDSTVQAGIKYFYVITAVAGGVESVKSIEAASLPIPPAPPTNVVVSSVT